MATPRVEDTVTRPADQPSAPDRKPEPARPAAAAKPRRDKGRKPLGRELTDEELDTIVGGR